MSPLRAFLLLLAIGAHLFAANRYVELGVPAPDREWVGRDYLDFAAAIKSTEMTTLPTLGDAAGREVLERATNPQNFSFFRNKLIPIPQRLQSGLDLFQGLNALLMAYANAANQGQKISRELVLLMNMTLRTSVVSLDLIDEFMAGLPTDDPLKEQRAAGLQQVRNGLTNVFGGAETSLSERKFYSASDLSLLLATMAETLPRFISILSPNSIVELRRKLERHRTRFQSESDRAHLSAMITALTTATKPTEKK